jgi:hypothetical protein
MLFAVHSSDVIENAGEPVSRIFRFPDLVSVEFPSLNPFVTREPPSTAPKSYDVMVAPPRCRDQLSDAAGSFPWPAAGTTSATTPTIATAPKTHRPRFIRFLSAEERFA